MTDQALLTGVRRGWSRRTPVLSSGLVGLGVSLVLVAFLSITLGSRSIGLTEVLRALTSLGADGDDQ